MITNVVRVRHTVPLRIKFGDTLKIFGIFGRQQQNSKVMIVLLLRAVVDQLLLIVSRLLVFLMTSELKIIFTQIKLVSHTK